LAVTIFFKEHVDKTFFFAAFFTKSMYVAYISQFVFPTTATTKCCILILQATDIIEYITDPSGHWYIANANFLSPRWVFTSAMTLLIVWPMAYGIRSIPGFSQVL